MEISHITYDNMLGADLKKKIWRWHGTRFEKTRWTTFSNALKLKMLQTERLKAPETGDHTLPTWVAQNIMRPSPLKSLEETAPKPYIICPHLNLQGQLQIQLEFRGWVQKLHCMHLEKKVQMIKALSPCNSLWKTTQVSYMAWPILSLGKNDKNQGKEKGLICKMATLQFIKGPNAKMDLTMLVSSSSYPKIRYGMPLIEKDVQIRFEFEFKFNLEINQKIK